MHVIISSLRHQPLVQLHSPVYDPSPQRHPITLVGNPKERESHHYTNGSIGTIWSLGYDQETFITCLEIWDFWKFICKNTAEQSFEEIFA